MASLAFTSRDVIEARIGDFSERGQPRQLAHLIYQSDFHIVSYYQAVYRGMVNYYRMAPQLSVPTGKLRWLWKRRWSKRWQENTGVPVPP
jgi:hypothetical protein